MKVQFGRKANHESRLGRAAGRVANNVLFVDRKLLVGVEELAVEVPGGFVHDLEGRDDSKVLRIAELFGEGGDDRLGAVDVGLLCCPERAATLTRLE